MSKTNKIERSWILYDWANSAYSIAITTAILPLYFKMMTNNAGVAASTSTALWGYSNSFATLLISLLAPILGTLADYKDHKKRFFMFFFLLGVSFTAFLAFVPTNSWKLLLGFYILTVVGFAGANIFYDSFLVDVTSKDKMDSVSTKGFAYGYIGSTIPFIISIIIIAVHSKIGLSEVNAYRISFVITALWWGTFTIPMIRNVRQIHYLEKENQIVKMSFKRLASTIKNISKHKYIFTFLIAYFFYIDGVNTVIKMAGVYGKDVGIDSMSLLVILLATQFVAFPFALLYGKLSEKYSGKNMIQVAIVIYIFICLYAYQLDSKFEFWVLAMLVASSQGGIQALSRSFFGKMVPEDKSTEFFGFYNIFGKFASILGPFLVGFITQLTGRSQNGVLSLILLFTIGGIILYKIPARNPDNWNF